MARLSVNGTQLWVERMGAAGALPLVLVHGSWVDHHDWDALLPVLVPTFQGVTYDRRGHGLSPRTSGAGSVREDAADLAALLERTGLAPAHVVASSFGGSIVLRLATERPELLRSLSVHEPLLLGLLEQEPALQHLLGDVQQHLGEVLERLRAGDLLSGARHFVEEVALGPGAWDALPLPLRHTLVSNAHTFLDEAQDPEGVIVNLRALASLRVPVLLTRGGRSPPVFAAVMAQLAHALPHAVQHVFVDAGHAPQLTHPQAYGRVLKAFATGVDIATGRIADPAPLPAH